MSIGGNKKSKAFWIKIQPERSRYALVSKSTRQNKENFKFQNDKRNRGCLDQLSRDAKILLNSIFVKKFVAFYLVALSSQRRANQNFKIKILISRRVVIF